MDGSRVDTKPLSQLAKLCCFRVRLVRRALRERRAKRQLKSRARRVNTVDQKVPEVAVAMIAADVAAEIVVDAVVVTEVVAEIAIAAIVSHEVASQRLRCLRTTHQFCCRANRFRNIAERR